MRINPTSRTVTYPIDSLADVELNLNDIEREALNNEAINGDCSRLICTNLNQIRDSLGIKRGIQRDEKWAPEMKKPLRGKCEMSQYESQHEVSISVSETGDKVQGKRVIDGYALELSNSLPCKPISGRTDLFKGQEFKLSVEQAELLYTQLGESLDFICPLLNEGKIILKQPRE